MKYMPLIPVTIVAADGSEKVCSVNLQRVLFLEPIAADADSGAGVRQTVAGYVPKSRSLLWLNVAGEILAVKETRDEIQEASNQSSRLAWGGENNPSPWDRAKNFFRRTVRREKELFARTDG